MPSTSRSNLVLLLLVMEAFINPRYFDEILQVLKLKIQTEAASRAGTGCGSNQ